VSESGTFSVPREEFTGQPRSLGRGFFFVAFRATAARPEWDCRQVQASALVFRARDLLVKQRTQIINALRGHLTEFGIVVAKGPAHVP
jgi:transposase